MRSIRDEYNYDASSQPAKPVTKTKITIICNYHV